MMEQWHLSDPLIRRRSEGDPKEIRRRSEGDPKEIRRRSEGDRLEGFGSSSAGVTSALSSAFELGLHGMASLWGP